MVSRRGIKLKFFIGERVLCYEPDTTKAKVLYDSKVLDVVITKDQVSGKKIIEYLIHFQGWNPSWDRRVNEEFVLKDTPENRQLQKDLADKAQLQLGAYLYRKERKRHNKPKPLENAIGSSEEGSSGSPAHIDTDDNPEMTSSSDESEDDEIVIEIVPELKEILEADYYLINVKNRRLKLPTEPNVVSILESYYRHYVTNQFCGFNEKSHSRYRTSFNVKETKPKTEDIERNLTLCREVIDGLRIYFDFKVNEILLYKVEKDAGQYITKPAVMPYNLQEVKVSIKLEQNIATSTNNVMVNENHIPENGSGTHSGNPRRRTLRSSNRIEPQTNGNSFVEETNGTNHAKPCSSIGSSNSDINAPMTKALSWRLLPDPINIQQPPPPCLVYGAIHFARLFVKLPELLGQTSIPDPKLKIILRHVDSIIDFLNDHKEWYGEKYYIDATV